MSQAPRTGPALLGSRLADDVPMRYLIQRPGPVDPNMCLQCRALKDKAEAWRAADGPSSEGLRLLRLIRAHRMIAHRGQRRQRVPA
jgi:hypothetical protein